MQQHNLNGLALAEFLDAHPKVRHVHYPGLPTHPQHELAKRQMRGFGGMVAFELGSLEAARRLLNGVRLMALAESLGGVETLISHPATMTHASVPASRRAALGITDGLVRISAGVEDIEDLTGRSRAGARPRLNRFRSQGTSSVLDFLLHSDRHLLEFVDGLRPLGLRDPVRHRLRRDRDCRHAVPARRLAALRHRCALRHRRPGNAARPSGCWCWRRSPATP